MNNEGTGTEILQDTGTSPIVEKKDPILEPANQEVISLAEDPTRPVMDRLHDLANMDIEDSAATIVEKPPSKATETMTTDENAYIEQNGAKFAGLEARYKDSSTSAAHFDGEATQFAQERGIQTDISNLEGKAANSETLGIIRERIQKQIDILFNSDKGTRNPEKHTLVSNETARYLELIEQAQAEEDLPKNLPAEAVMQLVEQNIASLAFQDREATRNMLGDHGVRHLIGHNVAICEQIFDQLDAQGTTVRAIDRLLSHQVMINHDEGYAMLPVRTKVLAGDLAADRGHNLLAAKCVRERSANSDSAFARVFSQEQAAVIHKGVIDHDSSNIQFSTGEINQEQRNENIQSAIHTADNTHAFEDKLPELLYTHADTLRIMRLMKTAAEVGDDETFEKLRADLVQGVDANTTYSPDDKEALKLAAHGLKANSYKFTVGRICGHKPEVTIDETGKVTISVAESAIHREVVKLFGQQKYDQLRKFVADLTGKDKKEVNLDQDSITSASGHLEIAVRLGRKAKKQETDYAERLRALIKEKPFQKFILGTRNTAGEGELSRQQGTLEAALAELGAEDSNRSLLEQKIGDIKIQRQQLLRSYLNNNQQGV